MEKDDLPRYSVTDQFAAYPRKRHGPPRFIKALVLACIGFFFYNQWQNSSTRQDRNVQLLSINRLRADHAVCAKLHSVPHDPSGKRERNARYVDGHNPTLIRNATVWTGEPPPGTTGEEVRQGKGYAWTQADVLLEHGLIKRVDSDIGDSELPKDCQIYDARGKQLTTGIVDMHSHAGVDSLPSLKGSADANEISGDITPYVRSIDGMDPLDPQIETIKSGGVTTSLILPGSANNMGGEAFVFKFAVGKSDGRPEISGEDMLADPERNWRYMKMACGENPKGVYGRTESGPYSRLGEAWYFRHAFEQATALVKAQDDWCDAANRNGIDKMTTYLPLDLKWESLAALLRGQVLLNTHCYTANDMEAFVRHTNEFNFSVRAFHHAHQAFLIPEVLKRAYGDRPPAAALFADFMNYKVESSITSEQAGRVLWENGITPVYVSDTPGVNAQHLVFEAARAYRNGLPYHVALAGVTSAPAELLGLGERIGKVKPGFDADVVVWDSDPLSVGATPVQVWIDGTAQFNKPVELKKHSQRPIQPNPDLQVVIEIENEYDDIIFKGVSTNLVPTLQHESRSESTSAVVVRRGAIVCIGTCDKEISIAEAVGAKIVSLRDGHLAPTVTAFGSSLGLVEIEQEARAQDGQLDDDGFSRALDGLALNGKNLKAAYIHGTTKAISAPQFSRGGFKGLSVGFRTGALNSQKKGAVWQDEVALHYSIAKGSQTSTLSSAVGHLRTKLEKAARSNSTEASTIEEKSLIKVITGGMALVVSVNSADHIAAVLRVKSDIEAIASVSKVRMVILGGAESHILAEELAQAEVGVVLAPMLPFGEEWDQRFSLIGAPKTNGTAIDVLYDAGVKLALGTSWDYQTRNLFLGAGIAHVNGNGKISESEALKFVSSNIYEMLGLAIDETQATNEFVISEGNPLQIDGRVRAVADGRGKVTVWS